ncbi:MAG: efflux RND transporter periplasmic adaptor subunit [Puniceicoccales bacterium]|nr:efflux RND transporter periplasmic adaptor subunit [Puniceicoccales bacterium]
MLRGCGACSCLLALAVFVFAGMPVVAVAQEQKGGARPLGPGGAPEVGVLALKAEVVPVARVLSGRVKPVRVAQVRARVAGILQKQIFREGSDVKEGDLLFQIDPVLFEARVASANASVAGAKAGIESATAVLTQARLLAARCRELVKTRAVSQQEHDNAVAGELQAEAGLHSATAALLAAQAALKAAELDLGYTRVTAPISGRIGRPFVTEGALVGQGEVTLLAEINQVETVYVDVTQPANELSSFKQKVGAGADWSKVKVVLLLDNGVEYKFAGKPLVSEITVDPGTNNVTLRVEFPNPDWLLWPGMYLRSRFEYDDGSKAFLVPHQAVMRDGSGASIYIVGEGNKLVRVPLVGEEARGASWVVREGLKEGMRVVVEGAQRAMLRLGPGSVVSPKPWRGAVGADATGVAAGGVSVR